MESNPLQQALADYFQKHPNTERQLADELRISHPTMMRWKNGRSRPHRAIEDQTIEHIKAKT